MIALLGRALRRRRAGALRSPLSGGGFDAPESITVTSSPKPPLSVHSSKTQSRVKASQLERIGQAGISYFYLKNP